MSDQEPMDTVFAMVDGALRLPADQRVAWVSGHMNDGPRRREVLAMLAAVSGGHVDAEPGMRMSLEQAVIGDFEVVRAIGCGAGGIVYEASQRLPRRRVALKVLRAGDAVAAGQLEEESQALARVIHPGIAAVYAAGIAQFEGSSVPWIAMELVDGAMTAIERARALRGRREQVAALLAEFADAIAAAHRGGVLHRDIKPANLLVDRFGRAKVVDFGIAIRIGQGSRPAGTPRFIAPECMAGALATVRSDVWSLGAVAGGMLDAAGIGRDDRLRTVARMATAEDPLARHSDAGEFARDVRRVVDGHPALAERPGWVRRSWMAARRHPVASIAVALAASTLVTAGAWSAWQRWSAEARGLGDAQRMLALHGEVTASIDRLSAQERPKAVADAMERGRAAFKAPFPDPEIVFLAIASLLRLQEGEGACALAGEAHAALASNAKLAPEDLRWIELAHLACEAMGRDDAALGRLDAALVAIGERSSGDDVLLAWYLHAVTIENRAERFRELAAALDARFNPDPSGDTWRTMLALAVLSWSGDRSVDPSRMELVARGMRRSYGSSTRASLAVTYLNLCVAGMLAAAERSDARWLEAMVPIAREAAIVADNPTMRVWTELSVANSLLGLGRYEAASGVLDSVARGDDLEACDETTLVFWLPSRVQAGLRMASPREQLVSIAGLIADRPKVASGDRLLAEILDALGHGERRRCEDLLERWRARQLDRKPGLLRDERIRLGDELSEFLGSGRDR